MQTMIIVASNTRPYFPMKWSVTYPVHHLFKRLWSAVQGAHCVAAVISVSRSSLTSVSITIISPFIQGLVAEHLFWYSAHPRPNAKFHGGALNKDWHLFAGDRETQSTSRSSRRDSDDGVSGIRCMIDPESDDRITTVAVSTEIEADSVPRNVNRCNAFF